MVLYDGFMALLIDISSILKYLYIYFIPLCSGSTPARMGGAARLCSRVLLHPAGHHLQRLLPAHGGVHLRGSASLEGRGGGHFYGHGHLDARVLYEHD